MTRRYDSMPDDERAFREEIARFRRTGQQDYANVGSPAEVVEDVGLTGSEDRETAYRQIVSMLLRCEGPPIEGLWTDRQKRRLRLAWAFGWASAAVGECLALAQRRAGDE